MMLDHFAKNTAQAIQPHTILFEVYLVQQATAKHDELLFVERAFEHRLLDSLTEVFTNSGDAS